MKKLSVILSGIILVGILTTVSGQDRKNVVKLGLLSPFVNTLNLAYEYCLNDDIGLQLRGYFTGASVGDTKLRGYGIIPEFRYYLSDSKLAPSGIFIAPYARLNFFTVTSNDEGDPDYAKGTLNTYGGGLLIGYQRLLKDRITLEAYIGPSYTSASVSAEEGDSGNIDVGNMDGFLVRGGITIGVAF
ncbi:MAG: DUF3575 domain-containing protein [Bacteroidales bacterium]|nr:DUF3575 domain-containing protein [Bacteroidales bacterium]